MKYRLLASDMDYTLLRDDYTISPRTQEAIHKWIAKGLYFVPNTGRPLCAMNEISALFDDDMPFIVYNGAMGVMHRSKEVLFSITLPPALVPEIYQLGNEQNIPVLIWSQEHLYTNSNNQYTRLYEEATNAPAKLIKSLGEVDELAAQGVTKILWMDYPENILRHQNNMHIHFGERVNCHASRPEMLEFVDQTASKATALEKIGTLLGVFREEMAAVGDGYNDLSMLKYAGYSIAMGNAPDEIKKVCDHVTLTNNEDGVAVWMEEVCR